MDYDFPCCAYSSACRIKGEEWTMRNDDDLHGIFVPDGILHGVRFDEQYCWSLGFGSGLDS